MLWLFLLLVDGVVRWLVVWLFCWLVVIAVRVVGGCVWPCICRKGFLDALFHIVLFAQGLCRAVFEQFCRVVCCVVFFRADVLCGPVGGGLVLEIRTPIVMSRGILLLNRGSGGRGGLKIPILVRRPL